MQEREKKKKQRQSIIMLSAVQTDIETKAQVGPHTAKPFKIKTEKKKKSSHPLILHRKKFFEKKKKKIHNCHKRFFLFPDWLIQKSSGSKAR